MIFVLNHTVGYRDVDRTNFLRPDSLVSLLQESAILHSESVGFNLKYMEKHGVAWVLNQFALLIHDYAFLRDNITIKTWSRGIKSFKALRDFEVFKDNRLIAQATSHWFFIDTKKRRISKVTEEVEKMYGSHDASTEFNINYTPQEFTDVAFQKSHVIRYSDIDGNGHLNNVVYLNMLQDTLFAKGSEQNIKEYLVSFKKEVSYDMKEILVSLSQADNNRISFKFNKDGEVYAEGVVTVA